MYKVQQNTRIPAIVCLIKGKSEKTQVKSYQNGRFYQLCLSCTYFYPVEKSTQLEL